MWITFKNAHNKYLNLSKYENVWSKVSLRVIWIFEVYAHLFKFGILMKNIF